MLPYLRPPHAWLTLSSALMLAGCGDDPAPVNTTETPRQAPSPVSTTVTPDQTHPIGETPRSLGASRITLPNQAPLEPSPRRPLGSIELLDPTPSPNPVEIGEPLHVDEPPWDTPTEPVDLGEPLDADHEANGSTTTDETTEPVDLGEPLDADDPLAISDTTTGDPTDLGEWRDASAPENDPTPATDPIDLGPPLEVPGTPLFN